MPRPNPKVVVRQALLAQPAVTNSPVGDRVRFSATDPVYPMWVLKIVDTIELRPETDTCRIQVDIWGDGTSAQDYLDAEDSAALLRSVARDLDGDWPAGKIRHCEVPTILPSPDPSGRARVIADLTFELNQ